MDAHAQAPPETSIQDSTQNKILDRPSFKSANGIPTLSTSQIQLKHPPGSLKPSSSEETFVSVPVNGGSASPEARETKPPRKLLVNEVLSERQRKHKEMLLRLFSLYSSSELNELQVESGASLETAAKPVLTKLGRKRKSDVLSRLPNVVVRFRLPEERSRTTVPTCLARDLATMKEETRIWHSERNPGQKLSTFVLKFNDCSLVAISRWACNSAGTKQSLQQRYQQVDPQFRLCLNCRLWGHYESECDVRQKLRYRLKPPPEPAEEPKDGPCKESVSTVVCEPCDGFIIEQRNVPTVPMWSSEHKFAVSEGIVGNVQTETTDIDGTIIRAFARGTSF